MKSIFIFLDHWASHLTTLVLHVNFSDSQFGILCNRINSMSTLKQLALFPVGYCNEPMYWEVGITAYLDTATVYHLAPTLARLERFLVSVDSVEALLAVFDNLGPNCNRLWIQNMERVSVSQIHKCSSNRQILSNLTHLHLEQLTNFKILDEFCKHTTSLQVLHVDTVWVRNVCSFEEIFNDIFLFILSFRTFFGLMTFSSTLQILLI